MLHPLTAAKIDHGLAKLELDQLAGEAPPPGQVTLADLARRAGVSEGTILKIERIALAKMAAGLAAAGQLPPHLAKRAGLALQALRSLNPES